MTPYPLLSKPLLAFSFSAFAIGLSEFVVIGLLTQIAHDLGIDLVEAGLLITFYAVGVSVGSPIITHITRKIASKPICLVLIAIFTIANLASAIIPSFMIILIARLIAGVMHGAYFSIASTVAPALVSPHRAPLAIAVMFSGLTVAMILGVPAGIGLGLMAGWKSVFIVIALLAALAAVLIHCFVPRLDDAIDEVREVPLSAYLSSELMTLYGITIFGFGGGFVFFSYIEPYLREALSLGPSEIARAMIIVGFGSLFGNALGGKLLELLGAMSGLACAVTAQAMVLVGLQFAPNMPVVFHILLFFWSISCFAVAPMVQTAVVIWTTSHKGLNPRFTAGLNATAFNIGISVATYSASGLIATKGMLNIPFTAATAVIVALPLCLYPLIRSFTPRMGT